MVVGAVLILPFFAMAQTSSTQLDTLLAQVAALKTQLAALQQSNSSVLATAAAPGVRLCVVPERTLKRGDTGDDVSNLQIYLAKDSAIYPEAAVVGVYGPATERAVQRWQKKYGLLAGGTPSTTGYGTMGARTLSLLQKVWDCSGPMQVGWFSGNNASGAVAFSAQTTSDKPLDASLSVDFGDGASAPVLVTSAVCKTLGGPCSSLMSASHAYSAVGNFTATLRQTVRSANCVIIPQVCGDGVSLCASIAPICTPRSHTNVLATTTIAGGGASSVSASGTIVPGTVQQGTAGVIGGPPVVRIVSPVAGTLVPTGGSFSIAWTSAYAPNDASVTLLLKNVSNGSVVGTIKDGLKTIGSFWWALPAPVGSGCTGDAFTCLTLLATPTCTSGLCTVADGIYTIIARIMETGQALVSAESGVFAIGKNSSIPSSLLPSASSSASASAATTTSYSYISSVPASSVANVPKGCLYSGVYYGDGISLDVGCTDVAGMSCGGYGGQSLTCKNGAWVNAATGAAANIPNVTTYTSSGTTCSTPWGSQVVQSGQQITYEPFFTGGNYTGAQVVPLMQCTNGSWQKCNWDGTGCTAYVVTH